MKQDSLGKTVQRQIHHYDLACNRIETIEETLPNAPERFVSTAWEYDAMGPIIKCMEAKGTKEKKVTTTYYGQKERTLMPNGVSYDALGRLLAESSTDHTIQYTYTYDAKDRILSAHMTLKARVFLISEL